MATVSDDDLVDYIQEFDAVRRTARETLFGNDTEHLADSIFDGGATTLHISTRQGLAIERRTPALGSRGLEVNKGSAPLDLLLVNNDSRVRKLPVLMKVTPDSTNTVSSFEVESYRLFELVGRDDSKVVISPSVRFIWISWKPFAGFERVVQLLEVFSNAHPNNWTLDLARRRALNEVNVAAVQREYARARHVSITEYLRHAKQKNVLVLGKYGGRGHARIAQIVRELKSRGYEAFTPVDLDDVAGMTLEDKVIAFAMCSRFVVLEDSEPSGHLYEARLMKDVSAVVAVVHESGLRSSFMTSHLQLSPLIKEWNYESNRIPEVLDEVVRWAETTVEMHVQQVASLYPWLRDETTSP